jgi:hypothetical protein
MLFSKQKKIFFYSFFSVATYVHSFHWFILMKVIEKLYMDGYHYQVLKYSTRALPISSTRLLAVWLPQLRISSVLSSLRNRFYGLG